MSKASEQEAARLNAERVENRCKALADALENAGALRAIINQMRDEADAIEEARRKGWQSSARAWRTGADLLSDWEEELRHWLTVPRREDYTANRPPIDPDDPERRQNPRGTPSPAAVRDIDAGPYPITPRVAAQIREDIAAESTIDAKLDAAFSPPAADQVRHIALPTLSGDPADGGYVNSLRSLCGGESGPVTNSLMANCPVCLDLHDHPANVELASTFVTDTENVTNSQMTSMEISAPRLIDPGPAPVRETQRRMTFDEIREHGRARARGADHRSYSQVSSFTDCGFRYALSDKEVPGWALVGGKAFHYAQEQINLAAYLRAVDPGELSDKQGPTPLWEASFARAISETIAESGTTPDQWYAAKQGKEGYDWWRVEGPEMVKRWVERLRMLYADGWTVATIDGRPAVEISLPFTVGGPGLACNVKVENIIDLVLVRNNLYLIIDAKTGATAPTDTLQLGQYGHAIGRNFLAAEGTIIAAYWLARKDEIVWAGGALSGDVRELHPWDEISYLYETLDVAESQGLYMPRKSQWCVACGVKNLCPIGPRK